jgi:hypothetical protein
LIELAEVEEDDEEDDEEDEEDDEDEEDAEVEDAAEMQLGHHHSSSSGSAGRAGERHPIWYSAGHPSHSSTSCPFSELPQTRHDAYCDSLPTA